MPNSLPDPSELPPIEFDARYTTIGDWAAGRRLREITQKQAADPSSSTIPTVNEVESMPYVSASKRELKPFERLNRELSSAVFTEEDRREITSEVISDISLWVAKAKRAPCDLIQRAEALEKPSSVYYGGQNRAVQNMEHGKKRAETYAKAGVAAVRREYERTSDHYAVAVQREDTALVGMQHLFSDHEVSKDEKVAIIEVLWELANGVAANLDNHYKGGDYEARIVGLNILRVMKEIDQDILVAKSKENRRLINAGISYVRKQRRLWNRQLANIGNFASEKGFKIGQSQDEVA